MRLTQISSEDLRKVADKIEIKEKLVKERDGIQREIDKLDAALGDFLRPPGKFHKEGGSGRMNYLSRVSELLQQASPDGLSVSSMADSLGTSSLRVSAFLGSPRAKSCRQIERIGRGVYAWNGGKARKSKDNE